MLSIGREDEIAGVQGSAGPDLRRLLTKARRPDPQFALPLQRRGLGVDPPGQHHVPVEAPDHRGLVVGRHADAEGEVGVVHALALGGQELHQLRAAKVGHGGLLRPEDLAEVRADAGAAPRGDGVSGARAHSALLRLDGPTGSPLPTALLESRPPRGTRARWCSRSRGGGRGVAGRVVLMQL